MATQTSYSVFVFNNHLSSTKSNAVFIQHNDRMHTVRIVANVDADTLKHIVLPKHDSFTSSNDGAYRLAEKITDKQNTANLITTLDDVPVDHSFVAMTLSTKSSFIKIDCGDDVLSDAQIKVLMQIWSNVFYRVTPMQFARLVSNCIQVQSYDHIVEELAICVDCNIYNALPSDQQNEHIRNAHTFRQQYTEEFSSMLQNAILDLT